MKKLSILIVDDHQLVRQAWSSLLNGDPRFHVIGATGSPEEAINLAEQKKPKIVLLDINLPDTPGFHVAEEILTHSPKSKIIAVTMYALPLYAKKMLRSGARGYVTKNSTKDEMIQAIITVAGGGQYICKEIEQQSVQSIIEDDLDDPVDALTSRELEIMRLVKQGFSSKDIATSLEVTQKTVEVHRYHILKKLNLKNTAALITLMNQRGI